MTEAFSDLNGKLHKMVPCDDQGYAVIGKGGATTGQNPNQTAARCSLGQHIHGQSSTCHI